MVELEINANTTGYFTTSPETLTHNGQTYIPVLMAIGEEEQTIDGQLPRLSVDVWNYRGIIFQFAKDNDLVLNDVTIRLVHTTLTESGAGDSVRLQVLGSAFADEVGRFTLGFGFSLDVEGPRRTWNRRDHPSIPFEFVKYVII